MALFADSALGQSLFIIRNGENKFWIEAGAPPDTRYRLQTSGDLQDWVNINDEVSGQFSYRFDSAGVTKRFFRLTPWAPPDPPITLVLIGDSTVADFVSNDGRSAGWGEGIHGYFKPNVRVVNLGQPRQSTKVFLDSAEKAKLLVIKPDFVLVQFGRFDAFGDPPSVTTLQEYADNLKTIVQTVRGFNGTPILITPVVPRIFDEKGKVLPALEDRSAAVKDVAAGSQTDLIDLNQLSLDLFNQLGDSASFYISWSDKDPYHFSLEGAEVIAGLVVNALPDSLRTRLVAKIKPPPEP